MKGGSSRVARSRTSSPVALSSTTGGTAAFSAGSGRKGKGHGLPHGFVSKAQWRFFWANPKLRAKYAHKEAHKTPGGPKVRYHRLPGHTGSPSGRRGPSTKG